ncbi:MAG: lysozyme inhibitor LprI family protein [Pseudomonadota bacterium]|nr:lysozyme inhibitor LprI family protein [Pseudomonadota bacterium]
MRIQWLWLALCCCAMPALATDYFARHQSYINLDCRQLQSNRPVTNCIAAQLEFANLEVNDLYNQLMSRYQHSQSSNSSSTKADAHLLKAQYQWLQFREQNCRFEALATGDQQHQTNRQQLCELSLTRERIDYLKWFLTHLPNQ